MSDILKSDSEMLNHINNYIQNNAGKRLRPLLGLLTAKACSGLINDKSIACAAASEIIHTATLLHDDVVDNGDYRRGMKTIGKLYSPGVSILVGDFWLTRAINAIISHNCPFLVMSSFAKALEDLAEGEILQMECADNLKTDFDDYLSIIRHKTSSLFIAAVTSPAIVSGRNDG